MPTSDTPLNRRLPDQDVHQVFEGRRRITSELPSRTSTGSRGRAPSPSAPYESRDGIAISPTDPEDEIGARIRAARTARRITLTALSQKTGISLSTLSRLESGQRKATVKLLRPIARTLGTSLEDLVGSDDKADPRVTRQPIVRNGVIIVPLSGSESAIQVFHHTIPADLGGQRRLQSHEGYEWVYVLRGRVRLMLGSTELILQPGDAAEFDTKTPHWFGNGGSRPAQYLTIFGPQGEKVHLRARPRA